jgi:peptide chain release factor subunit 1
VSDRTQEGSQFANGFGGIGAVLRYNVEFNNLGIESVDGSLNILADVEDFTEGKDTLKEEGFEDIFI